MPRMKDFYRVVECAIVAAAVMTVAACSLDKQEMPALSGPSELALSLSMTATPDQIPRDGSSQSIVTITARGPNGQVLAGQRITLALGANAPTGVALSQSEVTTGSDGTATFAVTAPVSGSLGDITVSATPAGDNAANQATRVIQIRATPSNTAPPTAAFSFSPASPDPGQTVTFNGSTTTDESVSCTSCTFAWDFGDGGTATGIIVTHAFSSGGSFVVKLIATDSGGSSSSKEQTVSVTILTIPTVTQPTVSPNPPISGQAATFSTTATAATNHRIVSYSWNWGDGTSSQTSGASVQHTYNNYGPFLVSVTVVDDLNQPATAYSAITVSSGLTATLTWAPASPNVSQTVIFTGTAASNAGSTITTYTFDFGDGTTPQSSAFTTAKHEYAASGAYLVKLTVTDDKGRTFTTAPQTLQVP